MEYAWLYDQKFHSGGGVTKGNRQNDNFYKLLFLVILLTIKQTHNQSV